MKRILHLFLGIAGLFALTACTALVPGDSYTKKRLHFAVQTWEYAAVMARLQEPRSCKEVKLIDTKVISVEKEIVYSGKLLMEGRWTEIWTFNKCGNEVKIRVVISAVGKGGDANIVVSAE